MNSGVYEIVNSVNGKRYVGSAVRFDQRWSEHRSKLRRGIHHTKHLQSSWVKHGEEAFEFRKLIVCGKQDLLVYEQLALDALQPEYNTLCVAGSSIGVKHSAETKAKIAAKALGRKRSRESIEKGAATVRGRKASPAAVAKLIGNKRALGNRHTDEWKAAQSARLMGQKRPKSPEHRAKIAAALCGRKATPEARANQSRAQTGTKRGPYRIREKDTQ